MTAKQYKAAIIAVIDEHSMDVSKEDYAEVMEEIAYDTAVRAEAARDELADESNE